MKQYQATDLNRLRLDKWLWYARIIKTRTLAQKIICSGAVRVNRIHTKMPNHFIQTGDVLTITLRNKIRVLKIDALAARRGPAVEATKLYTELTPQIKKQTKIFQPTPAPQKRPDKRARRDLLRMKKSSNYSDNILNQS